MKVWRLLLLVAVPLAATVVTEPRVADVIEAITAATELAATVVVMTEHEG